MRGGVGNVLAADDGLQADSAVDARVGLRLFPMVALNAPPVAVSLAACLPAPCARSASHRP
jgi:hypothetical protein